MSFYLYYPPPRAYRYTSPPLITSQMLSIFNASSNMLSSYLVILRGLPGFFGLIHEMLNFRLPGESVETPALSGGWPHWPVLVISLAGSCSSSGQGKGTNCGFYSPAGVNGTSRVPWRMTWIQVQVVNITLLPAHRQVAAATGQKTWKEVSEGRFVFGRRWEESAFHLFVGEI